MTLLVGWQAGNQIVTLFICALSLSLSLSLSLHFNNHFPGSWYQNVSILDFIGAKGDGGGVDIWSYKICKAPVKSLPLTNQHPVFYRSDALPVTQPTVSQHWKELTVLCIRSTSTRKLLHPEIPRGMAQFACKTVMLHRSPNIRFWGTRPNLELSPETKIESCYNFY